jgi:hypothetical protein
MVVSDLLLGLLLLFVSACEVQLLCEVHRVLQRENTSSAFPSFILKGSWAFADLFNIWVTKIDIKSLSSKVLSRNYFQYFANVLFLFK